MNLEVVKYGDMFWTRVAQDMVCLQAVINIAVNLRIR